MDDRELETKKLTDKVAQLSNALRALVYGPVCMDHETRQAARIALEDDVPRTG